MLPLAWKAVLAPKIQDWTMRRMRHGGDRDDVVVAPHWETKDEAWPDGRWNSFTDQSHEAILTHAKITFFTKRVYRTL
jgi:hypothetical protein